MRRNVLAAALLTLLSACATDPAASPQPQVQPTAAPAQQSPAPAPAVAPVQVVSAKAASDAAREFHPDDMVCRIYDITGTRAVKQRICKTRARWIEDARATQAEFRKVQDSDSPQISPAAPAGG